MLAFFYFKNGATPPADGSDSYICCPPSRPVSWSQKLTSMVNEMGEQVSAECQRQGAWEFLGEGVGAKLLCPDTGTVLTKNHFFGELLHIVFFCFFESWRNTAPCCWKGVYQYLMRTLWNVYFSRFSTFSPQIWDKESNVGPEPLLFSCHSRSWWVPATLSSCSPRSGDRPHQTESS